MLDGTSVHESATKLHEDNNNSPLHPHAIKKVHGVRKGVMFCNYT